MSEAGAGVLSAVCALGVAFILGVWWGLYLNVTHWRRMRRWAARSCEYETTGKVMTR